MKGSIRSALACLLLAIPLLSTAAPDADVTLPVLPVRILRGTEPSILENLENVRLVKARRSEALQLDIAHMRVLDSAGQLVAAFVPGNRLPLQGIVDKWRYARALQALSSAHPQDIYIDPQLLPPEQLAPPLPRFYNNEVLTYVVTGVPAQRQVVVFNLDAIGAIQLLYFRQSAQGATDTVSIHSVVRPIFGVEHVVAVSADDPEQMHALIERLREAARAGGIVDTEGAILQQIAALKDVRVGLLTEYTCESAWNCRR